MRHRLIVQLAWLGILAVASTPAFALDPGAAPEGHSPITSGRTLNGAYAATGEVRLSMDAGGSCASTYTIQVNKANATSTVLAAYLAAASTGFTSFDIPNGSITLNGNALPAWDQNIANAISSRNYWVDVTGIVAPIVNGAGPGVIDLTVNEGGDTGLVDGVILAVVFEDPSLDRTFTAALFFGAQDIAGDDFNILLGEPAAPSDPDYVLDMSLGISYGFQGFTGQVSHVDVNGNRMTSCAGGNDDATPFCDACNGALITVGGFDDSNANPANPFCTDDFCDIDDEMYDLKPFVNDGDVNILVHSVNPSNDDNILFAGLLVSGAAVIGEGGVLACDGGSDQCKHFTGETVDLTATLQDDNGDPVVGRDVHFEVISGPHAGTAGDDATDAAGQAFFSYTGTTEGIDEVQASFIDSQGDPQVTNTVTVEWNGATPVGLEYFTADRLNRAGVLRWKVNSQTDHAGFHVYRQNASGGRTKISDAMLQGSTVYEFVDHHAPAGETNYYLAEISLSGDESWHGPATLRALTVGTPAVGLLVARPNPFGTQTTFNYSLESAGAVRLLVYDASGRVLTTLVNEVQEVGPHSVSWDARDAAGDRVVAGVYFVQLETSEVVTTQKVVVAN
jgi:hypothetical protein